MPSWVTSSAIEFQSNGVKVMADLGRASARLSKTIKELQATVDAVTASLDSMSIAGVRATDVSVDLAAALSKSNTATTRAASRAARAAAAYDAMALSAARAAAGVQAVTAAGAAGGGGRGRFSLPGAGGSGFLPIPGPMGVAANAAGMAMDIAKRVGVVGLGLGVDAVFEASKFQQILLSIKNETGASNAQIAKFSDAAYRIGAQNGMSANEAGEILRTISRLTAGQFSTDRMIQVAPMVAKYASLTHFNRPDVGVEEAAKTGIQTAHLFRAYTPEALKPLLDKVYRLSGLMAEKPEAALKQMTYYVPLFKAAHISDETSLATMAMLDRAGFRNKVGTNVRALALESFGPLQITQSAQAGKSAILKNMGLLDKRGQFAWNQKDGGVDFFGELGAISKWAAAQQKEHVPMSKIIGEMTGALGKQGATVGALFLDKQMPGILDGIRKYLRDPNVGLNAAEKNRNSGFDYQLVTAGKNFQSLMTELGGVALPGLTKGFTDLGNSFHDAQVWLHEHKGLEKQWSDDISSTVKRVEQYLTEHRSDFVQISKDVIGIATVFGEVASAASQVIGPLTTVARIVMDIVALRFGDLGSMVNTMRASAAASQIDSLSDHAARIKAWQQYEQEYGKDGIPANVLRALPAGPNAFTGNLVGGHGRGYQPPAHPKRERTRDVVHHHAAVHQHFNITGHADPKAIGAAAEAGARAAFRPPPHPMTALGTGGSIYTHPLIPAPVSVGSWAHGQR